MSPNIPKKRWRCNGCQAPNASGRERCPDCGKRRSADDEELEDVPVPSAPRTSEAVAAEPLPKGWTVADTTCHRCQRVFPDVSIINDGDDAMGPPVCPGCYSSDPRSNDAVAAVIVTGCENDGGAAGATTNEPIAVCVVCAHRHRGSDPCGTGDPYRPPTNEAEATREVKVTIPEHLLCAQCKAVGRALLPSSRVAKVDTAPPPEVYIIECEVDYEPGHIVGVFATRELADAEAAEQTENNRSSTVQYRSGPYDVTGSRTDYPRSLPHDPAELLKILDAQPLELERLGGSALNVKISAHTHARVVNVLRALASGTRSDSAAGAPLGPNGRSRADALRDVLEQTATSENANQWARAIAQGTLDADDEELAERGNEGVTP